MSDHGVVCFATGTDEAGTERFVPDGAHAFSGVAAVALADGVFGEDAAADLGEVLLVDPSLAGGHDCAAVVEHEAVAVGVAEEVEGADAAGGAGVEGADGLAAGADPDELAISFGGLFLNPGRVGIAVLLAALGVAGAVNDPDEIGVGSVGAADLDHAEGGGADEVGPPLVMSLAGDAEIFPFPEGGAAAENDVFLGGGGHGGGQSEGQAEEEDSHVARMVAGGEGRKARIGGRIG